MSDDEPIPLETCSQDDATFPGTNAEQVSNSPPEPISINFDVVQPRSRKNTVRTKRQKEPMYAADMGWAHHRLAFSRQQLEAEKARIKQARDHGFPAPPETLDPEHLPEGVYKYAQAVKLPWCRRHYKTERRLREFVYKYKYLYRDSGLIAEAGFDILMRNKQVARRTADTKRKQTARQRPKTQK